MLSTAAAATRAKCGLARAPRTATQRRARTRPVQGCAPDISAAPYFSFRAPRLLRPYPHPKVVAGLGGRSDSWKRSWRHGGYFTRGRWHSTTGVWDAALGVLQWSNFKPRRERRWLGRWARQSNFRRVDMCMLILLFRPKIGKGPLRRKHPFCCLNTVEAFPELVTIRSRKA